MYELAKASLRSIPRGTPAKLTKAGGVLLKSSPATPDAAEAAEAAAIQRAAAALVDEVIELVTTAVPEDGEEWIVLDGLAAQP